LDRLSCSIREVVCRLEMTFPPAFFISWSICLFI
jgi:hypothetical protein